MTLRQLIGQRVLCTTTGICQLESHVSPLPEVKEMTPSGRWKQFHNFLRNAGFYKSSYSQVELISGFLELGEMEFPPVSELFM